MNEATHNEIIRRWRGGASLRKMARELGVSRRQVEQAIAVHQQSRQEGGAGLSPKKRRPSQLDAYQETIEQLLTRYPDITAVRVHEELTKLGFEGCYSSVKERLREVRPGKPSAVVQRFETAPGVQGQMDYSTYTIDFSGEGRRRVHLFGYLLAYSRRQYLRFVDSQDFTTTIREHIRAFEYLGGAAAKCLYDNMRVVVSGYDGDEPIYNTRFLAFATHYGYQPVACRPRRSQTKGKIERQFHYVETNLLNGRTFQSLEHLNDTTRWWLEHVADVRVHRETKQRPVDRHQEELAHLIPLPAQPYDTAEVVYRCVNSESLVVYCQNQYSVPWRYIGLTLPIRVTENELIVYGPQIEEVARHPLLPRETSGRVSWLKQHRPTADQEKKYEILKQRYGELGETASRFFEGLVKNRRYGKDEAQKVLALLEIYRREDLLTAIERAVRYGAYSRSAVERILAVQASPKTVLDQLAEQEQQQLQELLEGESVEPRQSQEYQQLLFEENQEDEDHEADSTDEQEPPTAGEDP